MFFVGVHSYKIHVKFETLKDDKKIKVRPISDESDANRYVSPFICHIFVGRRR